MGLHVLRQLKRPADTRILMIVVDGLGGLPMDETELMPLAMAHAGRLEKFGA